MNVLKERTGKKRSAYNRGRLAIIVGLIAVNFFYAVTSLLGRNYPFGLAAILFLIPCLTREFHLRSGRSLHRPGSFEWSCFIGGLLFFAVLPFLIAWKS